MSKFKNLSKSSKILYTVAGIVILIPLVLLIYIYFGAKDNAGKPTVGDRFEDSLNPAITEKQLGELKTALKIDGTEKIEINLISATLRVNIDTADDASADTITSIMNQAYDSVNSILPIETYFTNNKKSTKMYDVEINVYNYIPDETKSADGQIYMIKTKTAAASEPNVSVPTTAKNEEVAKKLLEEQANAEKGQ
ncbi:hypothetical protein ACWG0P_07775 [Amedibacillus sp. YH-ame6]